MIGPVWRQPSVIAAGVTLVGVVIADAVLRSLSGSASDFAQFLGRFHPLVVHLPIGVILLVAAGEVATLVPKLRPRIDPAIGLTLPLLVAGAVGAFLLGHLLARAGGFPQHALAIHRRLELFAVLGVNLCWIAWGHQSHAATALARGLYRGTLVLTLGLLGGGAHFGGTMTRGDTYLSKYAPSFLKPLLGGSGQPAKPAAKPRSVAGAEPLLFADVVLPILRERCGKCHGPEKAKGDLRLDSLAGIQHGGEDGEVVAAGSSSRSALIERLGLPLDDDDHMPPEDERQPTAAEIAVLRFWIDRGANDKLLLRDTLAPAEARALLERSAGASGPGKTAPGTREKQPAPASSDTPTATAEPQGRAAKPEEPARDGAKSSPERSDSVPAPSESGAGTAGSSSGSALAILADKCEKCHGASKQKAKLRVNSLAALRQGGKSGPAVVPGKPGESELIRRVRSPLASERHMPPKKEPQLDETQIATLAAWVAVLDAHPGTASPIGASATNSTEPVGATAAGERAQATSDTKTATEDAAATAKSNVVASGAVAPAAEGPPDAALLASLPPRVRLFADGVGPLLADRCTKCHAGKDAAGGLELGAYATLAKGGSSGPAVVANDAGKSLLFQRVSAPLDDGDHMPPEGESQLTPDEVTLIGAWIERGAGAETAAAPAELPAGAVRALAKLGPGDESRGGVARAGACAACSVGKRPSGGVAGAAGLGAVALAFRARRRPVRKR